MRILAVDYGDERTGMCVSDFTGTLAGEAWVIREWNTERLVCRIVADAAERQAERLVLGLPLNMDGTEGPRAEKARALAELLRAAGAPPVTLWDERQTTVDAHRILRQNGKKEKKHRDTVDAVAASLILEGYLAAQSGA